MQFINGLTILLFYQLMGEITARYFGLLIPGPVIGMIMLFITLIIKGHAPKTLEEPASALLSHLSLLFIPAGVGMMVHFDRIANEWLAISITLILSTVVTLAGSAAIMNLLNRFIKDTRNHKGES